jgi:hypothetical protein
VLHRDERRAGEFFTRGFDFADTWSCHHVNKYALPELVLHAARRDSAVPVEVMVFAANPVAACLRRQAVGCDGIRWSLLGMVESGRRAPMLALACEQRRVGLNLGGRISRDHQRRAANPPSRMDGKKDPKKLVKTGQAVRDYQSGQDVVAKITNLNLQKKELSGSMR